MGGGGGKKLRFYWFKQRRDHLFVKIFYQESEKIFATVKLFVLLGKAFLRS
jgi:hypothetical protein